MVSYVRAGPVRLLRRSAFGASSTACVAVLLRQTMVLELHRAHGYSPDAPDAQQDRPLRSVDMADVVAVSRSQTRAVGLDIQAWRPYKRRRFPSVGGRSDIKVTRIDLASEDDLYAWMRAIEDSAPSLVAMRPSGLRRLNHISVNEDTGVLEGIPAEWVLILGRSRVTRQDICADADMVDAILEFYNTPDGARAMHDGVFGEDRLVTQNLKPSEITYTRQPSGSGPKDSDSANVIAQLQALVTPVNPKEYYVIEAVLGAGAMGAVFEVRDARTGVRFAAKRMVLEIQQCLSILPKHLQIVRTIKHANIVAYVDSMLERKADAPPDSMPRALWIVMELVDGCALSRIIHDYVLSEDMIAAVVLGVVRALAHLHSMGIVHRDVKAENVLLARNGTVKLGGLGLAARLGDTDSSKEALAGTPYWMAPEQVKRSAYDGRADVWSTGVLLFEVIEGQPPYIDQEPLRAMYSIATAGAPQISKLDNYSEDLRDFMASCLAMDPEHRPAAADLVNHPFLRRAKAPSDFMDIFSALDN